MLIYSCIHCIIYCILFFLFFSKTQYHNIISIHTDITACAAGSLRLKLPTLSNFDMISFVCKLEGHVPPRFLGIHVPLTSLKCVILPFRLMSLRFDAWWPMFWLLWKQDVVKEFLKSSRFLAGKRGSMGLPNQ